MGYDYRQAGARFVTVCPERRESPIEVEGEPVARDASPLQERRVTRTKAEARAAYDRMSRWYGLVAGGWEKGLRDEAREMLHVTSGERVLEIGPGPGQDLVALARAAGQGGWAWGVDLSGRMARLARARAARAGLGSRVDLAQGDAERLPLAAGTMDAVLMSFTLELFDTPAIPLVLAEVRRVLRPGGRLGVVSLSKSGAASRMRDLYEWGHDRFPNLLDCRPILVRDSLEAAGFEILDAARKSLFGLPVEIVLGGRAALVDGREDRGRDALPEMTASALLELLQLLDEARIEVWLDGGWGVDALLGRQTRPHQDVDIIVRVADVPRLQEVLACRGFAFKEGILPTSFVLADGAGLEVDVHAVAFDGGGNGVYRMQNGEDWIYPAEGFSGRGAVGGRSVACLSPAAQVLCHAEGYVPTDKDRRDMALLHERFGVELPLHLRLRPA